MKKKDIVCSILLIIGIVKSEGIVISNQNDVN
jgi:hypothetical protein